MNDENNINVIGDRIKQARKAKKITQRQFADSVGISLSAVQGYEQGRYIPKYSKVSKMSEVLGVDLIKSQTASDERVLKPCPFCGATEENIDARLVCSGIIQNFFVIRCRRCNAMIVDMNENHCMKDIRETWNKRV